MSFWKGFLAGVIALSAGLLVAEFARLLLPKRVLGHLRYQLADARSLRSIDIEGKVYLERAAAHMFLKMQHAARDAGVYIIPLSGYRNYRKQHDLFFHGAREKNESKADRSRVCAPPGYSEHHTGYSLDVGDGAFNGENLDLTFKQTDSFRWMKKNASKYHFELSFPHELAKRRIAYEPWHWRYIGDLASFKTFFYDRVIPDWVTSK